MIKKALKLFLLFVLLWIVSFWVILREFRSGTFIILGNEKRREPWGRHRNHHSVDKMFQGEADSYLKPMLYLEKLMTLVDYEEPPGVNGTHVEMDTQLTEHVRALVDEGWKKYNFNEFVSGIISENRSLPDVRHHECPKTFQKDLPTASVIICFHNEAWSTLIRTINSVIYRSPGDLLQEIILIDDNSDMEHLKARLKYYVDPLPKVKLIRSSSRKGLIKGRMLGVRKAISPVIVFLDSHCECTEGWLEPLLNRISFDSKIVVSPVIDQISDSTFEYTAHSIDEINVAGFSWDLTVKEIPIPDNIDKQRPNRVSPIQTPVVPGIFAINKMFFDSLGYYDEEFDIWGGENLELSFKVWMCGGSLEIHPCSHVGHILRLQFPYNDLKTHLQKNLVRLAEVWMDDYANHYYARIANKKGEYGDVSKRKQLRIDLDCKSFEWYLKNIYFEQLVPRQLIADGQILFNGLIVRCLDVPKRIANPIDDIRLVDCHYEGGSQYWEYTHEGEIRKEDLCLDFLFGFVTLFFCKGTKSQTWIYDPQLHTIKHLESNKCLSVKITLKEMKLRLGQCKKPNAKKWILENYKTAPEWQKIVPKKNDNTNDDVYYLLDTSGSSNSE